MFAHIYIYTYIYIYILTRKICTAVHGFKCTHAHTLLFMHILSLEVFEVAPVRCGIFFLVTFPAVQGVPRFGLAGGGLAGGVRRPK